jgi:rRNA maturation protein Rpf1
MQKMSYLKESKTITFCFPVLKDCSNSTGFTKLYNSSSSRLNFTFTRNSDKLEVKITRYIQKYSNSLKKDVYSQDTISFFQTAIITPCFDPSKHVIASKLDNPHWEQEKAILCKYIKY